jgi:hypothetical protein
MLMNNRELLTLDERSIIEQANTQTNELLQRAGLN